MKKPLKTLSNILLIGAGTYGSYKLISNKCFDMVFKKSDHPFDLEQKYLDWLAKSKIKEVSITSYDGLKLNARLIENHKTNNYVIAIHGIWSNSDWMIPNAYGLEQLGYNILLIDQRTSGKSEGNYYTYGLKESFDLIKWTDYLIKLNKDINIIYYGVSMGAATCMMSTYNKLPSNVKCIVEDCGFSSLRDEIANVIKNRYKISNSNIILNLFENKMYDEFGFKFKDIVAKNALVNNELPLLIIHGEDDNFVPFAMSKIIYNNQKGYKKYYPVAHAGHGEALKDKNYFINIDKFIKNFVA